MIYKLSLYYNLIIKQKIFKKRQSYSQFEEDKFIFNFFSNTKKKVKKFIFHELIDEYKINLGNIDFLNIDVETHDFKVLKGINFKKYKPSLICIELYNKNLEIEEKKFIEFLSNYNYSLIKKIGPNGLFALNKWRGSSVG